MLSKGRRAGRLVSLPAYPWQRERFWVGGAPAAGAGPRPGPRGLGSHPLLGFELGSSLHPEERLWQRELGLGEAGLGYLADHRVEGVAVAPAALYLALALAAAREAFGGGAVTLERFTFERLLTLGMEPVRVQVGLTAVAPGRWAVRIASRQGNEWASHAAGEAIQAPAAPPARWPLAELRARCSEEVETGEHYRTLAGRGLEYGPAFQGIERLWRGGAEAVARLRPPAADPGPLHPALLDAAFQVLGAPLPGGEAGGEVLLPVAVERLILDGEAAAGRWCAADRKSVV